MREAVREVLPPKPETRDPKSETTKLKETETILGFVYYRNHPRLRLPKQSSVSFIVYKILLNCEEVPVREAVREVLYPCPKT